MMAEGIAIDGQEQSVHWERVMKAAESYFASPSTENALRFYTALPQTEVPSQDRDAAFSKVFYYISGNLPILEKQVLKADRNAVKAAIRLYTISDASFTEYQDRILGDLIRVNPRMFLEELRYFPWPKVSSMDFKDWLKEGHIVCHGRALDADINPEMNGARARAELEMRIKALATVRDRGLRSLRDACIKGLRAYDPEY
jgi:hypothetical protein